MTEIDAILGELLDATGASRVTLRRDVFDDVFPVTNEALADGTPSIAGVATPDMARQPVGLQVVQDDCLSASEQPHYREMLELYGGLRAQIVTPVVEDGRVAAIVSLHQLGRTRHWSEDEIESASETARRVGELL